MSYSSGWDECVLSGKCIVCHKVSVGHQARQSGGSLSAGILCCLFFGTVLITWLSRFWPWLVLAKQFQSRSYFFFPQHWVLLSSLCLWDTHVHHVSEKVPAPASKHCHKAMACLLQTLAYFFSSLGHPESTSRGHLNDLCTTSHMQTTYSTFTVWTTLC